MDSRKILISTILLLVSLSASAAEKTLTDLDKAVATRAEYRAEKEARLDSLQRRLISCASDEDSFEILGLLLEEYRNYNTDSAMRVAEERELTAVRIGDPSLVVNARMNTADVMGTIGLYKEALDRMEGIRAADLPDYLHSYYYHIYRTIYGLMADYSVTVADREFYEGLTDRYRDSLLVANRDDALISALIKSDRYNAHGEWDKAIALLTDYLDSNGNSDHDKAIFAYTLSESYRLKGDVQKEKQYLVESAVADMKTSVREYIALRKLAVILYGEGDIDRAYSYIKVCMDDAQACNARLRKLEILEIFPIIDDAYNLKTATYERKLKRTLIIISALSAILLLAICYVCLQMKKVASAHREVEQVNRRLDESNRRIVENSYLKEVYIGRYMDQCSLYIEKMDKYRLSLRRLATAGDTDGLYKSIKSTKFIKEELQEFYSNFDETFLRLFPSFVEDFNALLSEGEKIELKPDGRMSAELRIFALIRLGITDSVKIARFLRYSVTTIYNYRTKMRNKAAGDRNSLEQKVMNIGTSDNAYFRR